MFSRFYNLCNKSVNIRFVQCQRYYRRNSKKKNNASCISVSNNVQDSTPIIVCKRKEFNFYDGQTYPKYESIPLASKGWHHYKSKGDHFFIYPLTNVEEEAYNKSQEEIEETYDSFNQFGLNLQLVGILEKYGITKPLKIQTLGIPQIMNGANTVIAAETGCGKTLSYLIPMINEVLQWKKLIKPRYNSPLALIVTPSRELAFQIGLEARKICQHLGILTKTITGGKTKKIMLDPPVEEVDILVTSFGVISKLTTAKIYKLDMIRHIVLDEADALFHETFEDKLRVFLKRVPLGFSQDVEATELPTSAQFTLASATMPSRMSEVLKSIINVESLKHVTSEKLHHILVPQKFIRLGADDKPTELLKYIKPKIANKEQVIIFSNNTSTCNWVSMFLSNSNVQVVALNGDMQFYEKNNKYSYFKSGRCRVLCTTNAGSRGLDTITVKHVLNYDFPIATADYIHRCGRTGRVGSVKDCRVTNFICTPAEIAVLMKIERAVRKMKPIPIFNIYEKDNEIVESAGSGNLQEMDAQHVQEFSIPY